MKKLLIGWLVTICLTVSSIAFADGVPEDVLHDAILTLTYEDDHGEFWAEGHIVVGTEETEQTAVVYASVYCQNYGFLGGIFTDTGSGFSYPVTLTFDKSSEGYTLRDIQKPEEVDDQTRFWASVKEIMPLPYAEQIQARGEEYWLAKQQQAQTRAQAYVESLGRAERVGDYRELNLPLAGILVFAANQTISLSPPYPLWVTELERVENGERYVYSRTWEPDGATGDSQTYTMPSGNQLLCDGTTGTVTLSKTRSQDGVVAECITIRAELFDLFITFADEHGTKEYHFTFDGETYHQPTITANGSCQIDYPSFESLNASLPQ